MNDLRNRVVLITGASTGIGAAAALAFARAGSRLALHYNASADQAQAVAVQARELGAEAHLVQADLSETAAASRVVEETMAAYGRIDVLINNAGINRDAMSHKMTEEQWDQVLSVNLKGTFLCAQAALPRMRERGWGRVVNTSSIGSLGNIGQANYSASKAGVIGLTKTLALEYARYGVTVNCVAPGAVMTPMLAGVPDQIREKITAGIPVGRIAEPREIAAVHAFLASDDAAFITGQVIFVDGGMSVGV